MDDGLHNDMICDRLIDWVVVLFLSIITFVLISSDLVCFVNNRTLLRALRYLNFLRQHKV